MKVLIFIFSALLCTNVIASENSEVSKGNRVLKSTKRGAFAICGYFRKPLLTRLHKPFFQYL
ncbi:hypothetical protein, partial [Cysteiniphilum litorale]|uniref:hypothetical protein n=1 Tax=Cysteiniphilum litorale TaxID=2056700 RepID=UPI003F88279A